MQSKLQNCQLYVNIKIVKNTLVYKKVYTTWPIFYELTFVVTKPWMVIYCFTIIFNKCVSVIPIISRSKFLIQFDLIIVLLLALTSPLHSKICRHLDTYMSLALYLLFLCELPEEIVFVRPFVSLPEYSKPRFLLLLSWSWALREKYGCRFSFVYHNLYMNHFCSLKNNNECHNVHFRFKQHKSYPNSYVDFHETCGHHGF